METAGAHRDLDDEDKILEGFAVGRRETTETERARASTRYALPGLA